MKQRPFSILIGTPAAGGKVDLCHEQGLLNLQTQIFELKKTLFIRNILRNLKESGQITEPQSAELARLEGLNIMDVDIGLYTLTNESLLSRGRNHIAAVAIRQGWDKLFFIDSDAQFTYEQFMTVAMSPGDLVAGVCPLKVLPISLNYLPFEDDEHYYKDAIRSMDSLIKMRQGHGKALIPVAFVGTAFMCLSRQLLLKCAEEAEEYQYPNPQFGQLHTHWNMFDTKPMHGKYMSEDWSLCYRARKLGFEVLINADVVISHVGNMTYSPEMAQLRHIPKQEGVFSSNISDHPKVAT